MTPKPTPTREAEHSHHEFPDSREGDLWDSLSLHQAFLKLAEAIDPETIDNESIYIPPAVSTMIENLYKQLRDLHARDRAETAKMLKFQKKATAESHKDFKAE